MANTVYLEDLNYKYTGKNVQPDMWMKLSNTIWHGLGLVISYKYLVYQENSERVFFYLAKQKKQGNFDICSC